MISTIIDALDLAASEQLPTGARAGLAELRPVTGGTAPYVYAGDGQWTQVAGDAAGTFSYWRLTSPVIEVDTDGPSCNDYFQATYQLRLVSMVSRALCGNVIDAARSAASAIRGADEGVASALGLSIPRTSVTRVSVETDSAKVYQSEFGTTGDVPPHLTLIAVDVTFVATGSAACFAPCEAPGSLLCLSIERATWAKIKACMSEAQIAAATDDLCDNPTCDDGTVTFDGLEVGTVESGGTLNLDCGTTIDAAYVEDGGGSTGLYTLDGTLNGRSVYRFSPTYDLQYTGTNWRHVRPGGDVDAAAGSETYPWQADWSATALTVTQATISEYCGGPEVPCEPLTVTLAGVEIVNETNPCGGDVVLECDDAVDAVVVEGADEVQKNGTYIPSAEVNGRTSYELAPNHVIEWTGTQYQLRDIFTGPDWITTNAPATPWAGTWVTVSGGDPIVGTVRQATIADLCPCPVCEDAEWTLRDSADNVLDTGFIPSGGAADIEAPDGTVTLVDEVRDRTTIHSVRSGESKTITVSDWEGEFPAITPNTPTYVNEGDDTSDWTPTNGTLSTTSGIWRLTQTTAGVVATATTPVTQPVSGKDWALYVRARSNGTTGAQTISINGTGTERAIVYFNFNSVTGTQQAGTLSIRGINAAGTNSNAVVATGLTFNTDWQDFVLLFDSKNAAFALYRRQTDGSWLFGAHVNGTSFATTLQVQANSSTGGAWYEFDFVELVSPNFQSIGDSLTRGSTLFSPIVSMALTDGTSTWQRWAPVYTSLRNNLIVNKGVGGNTTAMVLARIQADAIDNAPKLIFLSACNNDYNVPVPLATRTANTQGSIDLCTTAGIPVILYNATYSTADDTGQPGQRDYYKEWWEDYRPTLTDVQGWIDIMGALRNPQDYMDNVLAQSDGTHPTPTGYRRMGQWIAALPYA